MTWTRETDKHLSDLRDRNELAELEILTSRPDDLPALMASGALTVSQMLIICELISSVRNVAEGAQRDSLSTLLPQFAEKRGTSLFSSDRYEADDDNDPFGLNTDRAVSKEEAIRRIKEYLTGRLTDDTMVETVNGPVRLADIPKGADGEPVPGWVDENCVCEEHTQRREATAKRAAELKRDDSDLPGLYV